MDKIPSLISEIVAHVKKAGDIVMRYYGEDTVVLQNDDLSPVTHADIASHEHLVDALRPYGIPVFSEESKEYVDLRTVDTAWILDPLDGTKDFIQKTGDFSVMLGLIEEGHPIFGAVHCPAQNKTYYAAKNKGAFVVTNIGSPKKIHVSNVQNLSYARLVVSRNHFTNRDAVIAHSASIHEMKKVGSNGIKIGCIAEGVADLFYNLTDKMGIWDSCAPHIILEESGGIITDSNGKNIVYNTGQVKNKHGIVASNGILHDAIIKKIHT